MAGTDTAPRSQPTTAKGPRLRTVTLAVVAAVAGTWWYATHQPNSVLRPSGGLTALSPPLPLPAFSLDSSGETPLTRDSLRGHWTLISLGFASCPDICPATLNVLARAAERASSPDGSVRVLFVSVDPERDTPERLRAYAAHFGPRVDGATGSHEQLQALTRPLGLFYERENADADYSVQHSTTVLLVSPRAEVVALISGEALDEARIARELVAQRSRA